MLKIQIDDKPPLPEEGEQGLRQATSAFGLSGHLSKKKQGTQFSFQLKHTPARGRRVFLAKKPGNPPSFVFWR
jgi:hypothetical protein